MTSRESNQKNKSEEARIKKTRRSQGGEVAAMAGSDDFFANVDAPRFYDFTKVDDEDTDLDETWFDRPHFDICPPSGIPRTPKISNKGMQPKKQPPQQPKVKQRVQGTAGTAAVAMPPKALPPAPLIPRVKQGQQQQQKQRQQPRRFGRILKRPAQNNRPIKPQHHRDRGRLKARTANGRVEKRSRSKPENRSGRFGMKGASKFKSKRLRSSSMGRITTPVTPNLSKPRRTKHILSTEERELKAIEEARQERARKRKVNAAFFSRTHSSSGAVTVGGMKSKKPLTIATDPFKSRKKLRTAAHTIKSKEVNFGSFERTLRDFHEPVPPTPKGVTAAHSPKLAASSRRRILPKKTEFPASVPEGSDQKFAESLRSGIVTKTVLTKTHPHPPKFATEDRKRDTKIISHAEQEAQELANRITFRARPLNRKVLEGSGAVGVPKVTRKPTTKFRLFHLSNSNAQKRDLSEPKVKNNKPSKSRKISSRIVPSGSDVDGNSGRQDLAVGKVKPKMRSKSVRGKSVPKIQPNPKPKPIRVKPNPRLSRPSRSKSMPPQLFPERHAKKQGRKGVEKKQFLFKARPAPHNAPWRPVLSHKKTQFNAFGLQTDKRIQSQAAKRKEIEMKEEEERKKGRIFKAREYKPVKPMEPLPSRPPTQPEPFKLPGNEIHQKAQETFELSLREKENQEHEMRRFSAKQIPKSLHSPFTPQKSARPLTTIQPFHQYSDVQAEQRLGFEDWLAKKQKSAAERDESARIEQEKQSEKELKKYRKSLTYKARSNPHKNDAEVNNENKRDEEISDMESSFEDMDVDIGAKGIDSVAEMR